MSEITRYLSFSDGPISLSVVLSGCIRAVAYGKIVFSLQLSVPLTLGRGHTVQYADGVLECCTLKTCVILLTNVTPINSINIF